MAKWWVHRFLSGASASYKINDKATMTGEDKRSPENDNGHGSVAIAEAALSNMGVENGQTWYIHRFDATSTDPLNYSIDHSPTASGSSLTCPSEPPGYGTIRSLANGGKLSYLDDEEECAESADATHQEGHSKKSSSKRK